MLAVADEENLCDGCKNDPAGGDVCSCQVLTATQQCYS